MQDLKSYCRLCASDGIHKIDIFLIENKSCLADDLNQLCNLKLENITPLPTKICEQCITSIKNLKQFLFNSIKTQKLLTELISNEINNSNQLQKEDKIIIDHGIKQEEDDLSSSNTENDLIETWFSEDELIEENGIKENNSSKKTEIFQDKNLLNEEKDQISDRLKGKDILEDLSLKKIKGKINKKRCKTNNLKKEKQYLENKKILFGEKNNELSGDLKESKKDIPEDLPLREIKGNINKKSYKRNNSKKKKSQLENDKNLIKDISESSKLLKIEESEIKKDTSTENIPNKNSKIFDKKNDVISDSLDVSEDLPLSEIKRKINKRPCQINNIKKEKPDLENDNLKDISKNSKQLKEKIVKSTKKQSGNFICTLCERSYIKEAGLTHHMRRTHSIKKDPHPCRFCDKKFKRRQALQEHENTHLPIEERTQMSCPHCDKKFYSVNGRWTHIRSIHDDKNRIVCEQCGKIFATANYLLSHKQSHLYEKKFQCSQCPAKFKSKSLVKMHSRSHGESHPCLECGVHLKTKSLLKEHMVIHSDVRNFKCYICNNDFKRKRDLKYHIVRRHMEIKPFECRICHERFSLDRTNNYHFKKRHPKEFKEMTAKKECLSTRHFPSLKQLLDINEAAKNKNINTEKTNENIVENSEV